MNITLDLASCCRPDADVQEADAQETDALTFSVTEVDITTVREGGETDPRHLYRDTNVMVVLNCAGAPAVEPHEDAASTRCRIGAAKAVLANLLHSYDTSGDVRVTVVLLNGRAVIHFPWGSVAGALASLDSRVSENPSNYSDAGNVAQAAWTASGKLSGDTADVIYFLSDGEPIIGGGSSLHPGDAPAQIWTDFLENPQNDIDHVYAVGIGSGIKTRLGPDLYAVARPDGLSLSGVLPSQ